ncbi:FecR domain-containing protein [Candidatus Dojkabacteria bacterium]|nr:FecR domain-containing protein [Candidatus Dojkabacteria bacterium]
MSFKISKRITIKFFIIFFFVFFFSWGLVLLAQSDKDTKKANYLPQDDDASALLVIVEPNISITRNNQEISVSSGEVTIYRGDVIKTDDTGLGYIIFSDNSIISLDHNTEIEIIHHKEEDESFNVKIKQLIGRTWSRVVNLTGKEADYQLETSNTIAVIRGTEFECYTQQNTSTFYTHEGTIVLKLQDLEFQENEILLEAGKMFENNDSEINKITNREELLTLKKDITLKEDYWYEFIECLDKYFEEILKTDSEKVKNYLKQHKSHLECKINIEDATENEQVEEGEVEGESTENGEHNNIPVLDPIVSNVTISINEVNFDVTCSWQSQNASYYRISIGTAPGAADKGGWSNTNNPTYLFPNVGLNSGVTYYCNVVGVNQSKQTNIITSQGQYLDLSSGNFSPADFSPNTGGTYTGSISGKGNYYNIPLDHLKVRFFIQNEEGKFFNGSSWEAIKTWFITNPSQAGTGFQFQKSQPVVPTAQMDFYFELYNHFSGKVLNRSSIYNVKCS